MLVKPGKNEVNDLFHGVITPKKEHRQTSHLICIFLKYMMSSYLLKNFYYLEMLFIEDQYIFKKKTVFSIIIFKLQL